VLAADQRRRLGIGPTDSPPPDASPPAAKPTPDAPLDLTSEPAGAARPLTRRAVVGLVLLCLVGVSVAAVHLVRSRPSVIDVPAPVRSVPATARPAARIVVDVAGAVRKPGVYTMAAGSRLGEAITRAGGAVRGADTASLNLARLLVDGEQVLVPMPGRSGSPVGTANAAPRAGSLVDLNTATLDQVEALPGVGPVLAQRILDWRREHGRFSSIDELREVSGIGEQKFHDLRDKVRV